MSWGAEFSPCGQYRYVLRRGIGPSRGRGHCVFIMLNPSTADEVEDDPTIRRCAGFARSWEYGVLEVVNLFAFRARDPQSLFKSPDPIGTDNNQHILAAVSGAELVIAAWSIHGTFLGRSAEMRRLLVENNMPSYCLGLTKGGEPRHPLYVPQRQVPLPM